MPAPSRGLRPPRLLLLVLAGLANLCLLGQAAGLPGAELRVANPRCEYLTNPIGVDEPKPRLSWEPVSLGWEQRQTSYQIQACGSPQDLQLGIRSVWDSGRVRSPRCAQVEYGGPAMKPGQRLWWRVRLWDRDERPGSWSVPSFWEMGLLSPQDWQAQWIDDGGTSPEGDRSFEDDPAPLFRRTFEIARPIARARLYITGLGYYEARINGARVGDRVLDPGWTAVRRRVLYSTYDVGAMLRRGSNCLAAMVGNGWYNPLPLKMWGHLNLREHLAVGRPRLIGRLVVDHPGGGQTVVVTDGSWQVASGPLLRNSIYLGETYDARREIPGWDLPGTPRGNWKPCRRAVDPVGPLRAQAQPPVRARAAVPARSVREVREGIWVVDLGINFAGWPRLRVRGEAGTRVTVRCGELLNPDGTVNVLTSTTGQIKPRQGTAETTGPGAPRPACQSDSYVLKGEGEEVWSPRFTFHGFRYVEVRGFPGRVGMGAIQGIPLSPDVVDRVSGFTSADGTANLVQEAVRRTFLSNLFSVQSDCPHREKFGYGGDIVPTGEAFILNFDMAAFYTKVVNDFLDAQRPNGGFTETAPYVGIADQGLGGGAGPIGWAIAPAVLCDLLHRHYGDTRIVARAYPALRRCLALMLSRLSDGVASDCIGDHESLDPKPTRFTSTLLVRRYALLMAGFARLLGRGPDAQDYTRRADELLLTLRDRFYHAESGKWDSGTQACQALALTDGLAGADTEAATLARLKAVTEAPPGGVRTGIFGTPALMESLSAHGSHEQAWGLATRPAFPGWGHMINLGATTLWETWRFSDNVYSHNHPMFGSISTWLFKSVAGVRPAPGSVGWDSCAIEPVPLARLQSAGASVRTIRGVLRSNWVVRGGRLVLTVEIPVGTQAVVRLPITESAGITILPRPSRPEWTPGQTHGLGGVETRLGSGRWTVTCPLPVPGR